MKYQKNINIGYNGDYNTQLDEVYKNFKSNQKGFGIEKDLDKVENIKICAVKDIDFVNYLEYSEFTIVLVKSECQVTDNYDNNNRNYFWFKDDETLIRFFEFIIHITCLELDVHINLVDVFAILSQKNNEKVLPIKEIVNEMDVINSKCNMFIGLYCSDLGFGEINKKIQSLFKPLETKDYNIILGILSSFEIRKEFMFSVVNK